MDERSRWRDEGPSWPPRRLLSRRLATDPGGGDGRKARCQPCRSLKRSLTTDHGPVTRHGNRNIAVGNFGEVWHDGGRRGKRKKGGGGSLGDGREHEKRQFLSCLVLVCGSRVEAILTSERGGGEGRVEEVGWSAHCPKSSFKYS